MSSALADRLTPRAEYGSQLTVSAKLRPSGSASNPHRNRATSHSGPSDYNVMVNSLFNPEAPLSPIWATRMCNEAGGEPKSAV
jgi:hypothetical protein